MRLPAAGTDLRFANCIAFGVVTVDVAAFFLIVVITCTCQTAGRTLTHLKSVLNACFINISRVRNIIVRTIVSVNTCVLSASAAKNFQITVACAVLGKVVILCAERCMVRIIVLTVIITILTSGNYGNTCFAVLICFICKGVGVLVFVVRVLLRSPTAGTDFYATDRVAFGGITVGVAAFSYIVIVTCTCQTTSGALVYFNIVRNTRFIDVSRTGYVIMTTVISINTGVFSTSAAVNLKIAIACAILAEIVISDATGVMIVFDLHLIKSAAFRTKSSIEYAIGTTGCTFHQCRKVVDRIVLAIGFNF